MRRRSKPVRRRPRRARSRRIAAPAGSDPRHIPITSLLSDHVPGHVSSHVTRTTLTPQHLFPPHPFHAPVPGLHSPGGKVRLRLFRSCVQCLLHATHTRRLPLLPLLIHAACVRSHGLLHATHSVMSRLCLRDPRKLHVTKSVTASPAITFSIRVSRRAATAERAATAWPRSDRSVTAGADWSTR